jgi:hypothetical protein
LRPEQTNESEHKVDRVARGIHLTGGNKLIFGYEGPRQCPLVLLVNVG